MTSGTAHIVLPEARVYAGRPFPACVVPVDAGAGAGGGDAEPPPHGAELVPWARRHAAEVARDLRENGAILFRGFGGPDGAALSPSLFAQFVDALGWENFPYVGGNAVRTAIPDTNDRVFTANESPPDKPIPFHHELAQTPVYPGKLLFYCQRPAATGGETPVLLSTRLLDDLYQAHPEFVRDLETHGVRYSRVMTREDRPTSAIGRGWAGTFCVSSRADAEAVLASRGYEWEWLDPNYPSQQAQPQDENALLRETSPVLTAVLRQEAVVEHAPCSEPFPAEKTMTQNLERTLPQTHVCAGHAETLAAERGFSVSDEPQKVPNTGVAPPSSRAFFNQLLAVWGGWKDEFNQPDRCVFLGNGKPLDAAAMNTAVRLAQEHCVGIPWHAGDILAIDNLQVQHSRNTFSGPRRVLASLTK